MIQKYRKLPVVVEAVQYFPPTNCREILEFTDPNGDWILSEHGEDICNDLPWVIHTLEGDMEANPGDFIIKGVNGEFYPCKPDIFEKTYVLEDTANAEAEQAAEELRALSGWKQEATEVLGQWERSEDEALPDECVEPGDVACARLGNCTDCAPAPEHEGEAR